MELTIRTITLLITSLLNLGLGGFLMLQYRKRRLTRVFSLVVFGTAGFTLLMAGVAGAPSEHFAYVWTRLFIPFSYLLVAASFHFLVIFSRHETPFVKVMVRSTWVFFIVWALFRVTGILPIQLEQKGVQGWFPVDPYYRLGYVPVYAVLFISNIIMMFRRRLMTSSIREKNQLDMFFVLVPVFIVFSQFNMVKGLEFIGALAPVIFTAGMSYAIIRHRMLDVSLVIGQSVVVTGVSAVFGIIFVGLLVFGGVLWQKNELALNLFAAFGMAMVISIFYDPLKHFFAKLVNRGMGIRIFDPNNRLVDYSLLIAAHAKMHDYYVSVSEKLCEEMGVQRILICIKNKFGDYEETLDYISGFEELPGWNVALTNAMERLLYRFPRGFDLEDLLIDVNDEVQIPLTEDERFQMVELLRELGIQTVFPIPVSFEVNGVLMVGKKQSGHIFNENDYSFLSALAMQIGSFMQNNHLNQQVAQADRLSTLGTLSASLAHELRNPLTSISAFVQMLPMRGDDPSFLEKFETIVRKEVSKLTGLTEQLLSFSRPTNQKMDEISVRELSEGVVQLLNYQFLKKGIKLSCDYGNLTPEQERDFMYVYGNQTELSQVLINLLLNSMQASQRNDEVMLRVFVDAGNLAVLSVEDKGSGMTAEQMKRVFEPFYTTKEQGTGLGLPTCKRVVEQHGGEIQVSSEPGVGTVFRVVLPCRRQTKVLNGEKQSREFEVA